MDNLNDRFKEMFEMIGSSLSNIILPFEHPLYTQIQQQQQLPLPSSTSTSNPQSSSSNNRPKSIRSTRSGTSLRSRSRLRMANNSNSKNTRSKSKRHHHHHHHHHHQQQQQNSNTNNNNQTIEKSTKSRRTRETTTMDKNNRSMDVTSTSDKYNDNSLPFASGLNVHLSDQQQQSTAIDRRYSCSVFFIQCIQHRKIALTKPSIRQAVWMPFMPMPMNKSWNEGGLAGLLIVLSNGDMDTFVQLKNRPPFQDRWIIEVAAIQLPQTLELINRITWMIKLDSKSNFKCCQDNDSLIWVDENKLDSGTLEYMWGPELIDFYRLHIQSSSSSTSSTTTSPPTMIPSPTIGLNNNDDIHKDRSKSYWCSLSTTTGHKSSFVEYSLDSAFQFLPRNPPRTDEEAMLLSSNLSEKDIERLYSDFLDHCFPSMAMAFHSFRVYMTKYGFQFEDERLTHLFFAFNYNSNGSITFPELLMGLACIDCHSIHNEVRAKFVMRYYDVHKRNFLTRDDIRQMITAIHPKLKRDEAEFKLNETLQAMEPNMTDINRISYKAFVGAVGSHRFRGTSKLCRADRPVFQMITNIIFTRRKKRSGHEFKWSSVIEEAYSGICSNCKEKQSILCNYLLRIDSNGYVESRHRLRSFKRRHRVDGGKSRSTYSSSSSSNSKRKHKNNLFHKTDDVDFEILNIAWSLIRMIRDFSLIKGDVKRPNGFMANNHKEWQQLYEWLLLLEKRVAEQLETEYRCVQVNSPAYIIGDIHGNIDDLLTLEQCLWKQFPAIDANLIFLGDYVDRGRWSIECVIYLMCLKILMPNKMTLLRGNHEVRPLQAHYSYKAECLTKYGEEIGGKIWELTNRMFDRLPLCAIIDEAIFCAHGGIPRSTIEIGEIQRLDNYMPEPEHSFPIAWEILWSDPIHQQQFLELACLMNGVEDPREGFLPNRKRGTAFVFNEDAATKFLKHNGLTHIVRAHEVPTNGFFFHFDKKCATIFSSSHYCGNNNECAVMLVEGDSIRIIRIDTTNNPSATD
ncbi:uncharacterized protein LOC113796051 [Dermatophagoides pteronyssinus]|uniref:uncharacterized protein LOC113796051 n=1 Tax=Dermatophagoides pteronyssinus TaxID=6956 RepID=UPI003F6636E5